MENLSVRFSGCAVVPFLVLLHSSQVQPFHVYSRTSFRTSVLRDKRDAGYVTSFTRRTSAFLAATDSTDNDDMAWLKNPPLPEADMTKSTILSPDEHDENDLGNVHIPATGVSVTDELERVHKDVFVSDFVPIRGLPGVAQIVSYVTRTAFDPVRYLVNLSPSPRLPSSNGTQDAEISSSAERFVLTDIPPYSDKLCSQMRQFMGPDAQLDILVTSRDAIHYNEASAVFTTRKSDLEKWKKAFPEAEIVIYRLDIPRDCRELVTQRLDGYGPWALQENSINATFVETGRPLTVVEWDEETVASVFDKGETPPDEAEETESVDENLYTPEAIRSREDGKRILAVYTPGHTFGSLTYIFPHAGVCCSGSTIPVEDTREEENYGMDSAGPVLDCRGYVTTSKAGLSRQMESARNVINTYADRFTVVLPARGDPLFLDDDVDERKETLLDIVEQYDKLGKIYESLGITSSDDDED